jgi:hypothetical protein
MQSMRRVLTLSFRAIQRSNLRCASTSPPHQGALIVRTDLIPGKWSMFHEQTTQVAREVAQFSGVSKGVFYGPFDTNLNLNRLDLFVFTFCVCVCVCVCQYRGCAAAFINMGTKPGSHTSTISLTVFDSPSLANDALALQPHVRFKHLQSNQS